MPYLLFLVLILGDVRSQTGNGTKEELSNVESNQTFRESFTNNHSTTKPDNLTSGLYEDEVRRVEERLKNNSTFIPEDDERFQDQENKVSGRRCQEKLLEEYSREYCGEYFHTEMSSVSPENWCEMEHIFIPYEDMTNCLINLSGEFECFYPNPIVQDFFLSIHSHYFYNCSNEESPFADPPDELLVALTLLPVSLIPVLVYLVVCKSSVKE